MFIDKKVLTVPQAADFCAVERMTMWRWVKAGHIDAFVTPGGHYRILREDLLSFLDEKGAKQEMYAILPNKKILVVDDEESVCKILKKLFERELYEVEIALNGFEAGIKILKFKPEIIILDLNMPGMNGFEVCKMIKSNPVMSHIKVMVFTGFDTEENMEKAINAGVDGFLQKSVPRHILLDVVSKIIGAASSKRVKNKVSDKKNQKLG
jgi:excisionase family DNA binding protein